MLDISPLVTYRPKRLRDEVKHKLPLRRGVLHITGRSTYLHAQENLVSPLVWLGQANFLQADASFSHYAVDPWGYIGIYALESVQSWAQGWKSLGNRARLAADIAGGKRPLPAWWLRYWSDRPGLLQSSRVHTVTDLLDDKGPNSRAFSIEFIQFGNQYLLTEAQYRMGNLLIVDICTRHNISMREPFVIGHEDINPFTRGTKAGGWDPGARRDKPRFCWTCMLTQNLYHENRGTNLCKYVLPTPEMPKWARL